MSERKSFAPSTETAWRKVSYWAAFMTQKILPGAHGEVAARAQGRNGGEDVVLGAVGGEIAHVGGEGLTFLERRPHGVEGAVRHLGMPDEVVRHLDQLLALGSGQAHENIIRPLDDALGVRGREEDLIDADLVDRSRGGVGRHASRSSRSCSGDGTGLIAGGAYSDRKSVV